MARPLGAVAVVVVFMGDYVDTILEQRVALVTEQDLGRDEDDHAVGWVGWVGYGGQLNGFADGALFDSLHVYCDCHGVLVLRLALQ